MKAIISILLIITISVRSFLPIIDYMINYKYITTVLCINKNRPELLCNGICYIKKELAKTEQNTDNEVLKLKLLDLFVTNKIFEFEIREFIENIDNQLITNECSFFPQKFYVKFFHPPMWKF